MHKEKLHAEETAIFGLIKDLFCLKLLKLLEQAAKINQKTFAKLLVGKLIWSCMWRFTANNVCQDNGQLAKRSLEPFSC